MRVGVRVFVRAPAPRWEAAPFLRAGRKNTGLLVFDLHALLCVNENQQFPPMALRFGADADVCGQEEADSARVCDPGRRDSRTGFTSDKRSSVSSCGGRVMM